MSERRLRRTPGGVCSLELHVVWCPKYRRRVLGGHVAVRCGELVELIAAEHGWEIVAREVMPEHVHLFARVGPTDKGCTARLLLAEFAYLGRLATVWWSPSFFAAWVGDVSESRVRRYVEHQCDAVA